MAAPQPAGRDQIEQLQLGRLRQLLSKTIPANPFYIEKFRLAGVGPEIESLAEFSARFPFTTKQELSENQAAHPPYGTNLTYPLEQYCHLHQTSGTTGSPVRWLDTANSWQNLVECWKEVYQAAGVTRNDRIFFAFSFGPFIGFWLAFAAGAQIGALCIPGGGLSTIARLRILLDNESTILCCTPTYAIHLAEVAGREKLDLRRGKVRIIIVAGEPGGSLPATRAHIERLWPGAKVFDHHGMTETGPVTYECPAQPCVLHVIESGYLPEIINPTTGEAVLPGESGELVLTTLLRDGSPLIRYRTGDLVRLTKNSALRKPCVCGRDEVGLDGGILGRVDDMVVVRGVNIYPTAVEQIVREFAEVLEYRVNLSRKGAMVEIQMQVEAKPGSDCSSLGKAIETAFQAGFSLRIPVECVPEGTLPRAEMKARRWIIKQS